MAMAMATLPTTSSSCSFHVSQLPWKLPASSRFFCFSSPHPPAASCSPSSSSPWRGRSEAASSARNGSVHLRRSSSERSGKLVSITCASSSSSSSPSSVGDAAVEESSDQESSTPLEAFCYRNASFLESTDCAKIQNIIEEGRRSRRTGPAIFMSAQKAPSLSQASPSTASQDSPSSPSPSPSQDSSPLSILVFLGSEAFVDSIFEAFPNASVHILHYCLEVLSSIKEKHDDARCFYLVDTTDFSDVSGSFDTIYLNYFPIFSISLSSLLEDAVTHCKPDGNIVISLGQGKANVAYLKEQSEGLIQSLLPDMDDLMKMVLSLPLELISFEDTPDFYLAILQFRGTDPRGAKAETKPVAASKEKQFPLYASGNVIRGFGRGNKLGFPTANLSVVSLPSSITKLGNGVYYGCAQVIGSGVDSGVYRMVMNLGNRPTFKGDNISLEVHILHDYGMDFYGMELRVAILGFIREEMQFSSVDDLIQRIRKDVELMQMHLTTTDFETEKRNSFFIA